MPAWEKDLVDKVEDTKPKGDKPWSGDLVDGGSVNRGNKVEWVNRELFNFMLMPSDLINAGIKFAAYAVTPEEYEPGLEGKIPQIPTDKTRAYLHENAGLIPDPSLQAETVGEHVAGIVGSSIIPTGAFIFKGNQVLNRSIQELQKLGVVEHLTVVAAQRPGATIAGDILASTGSGTARAVAQEQEAPESVQLMAELFGAFVPGAAIGIAGKVSFTRALTNTIKKHLLPFTRSGAWPRASKALQKTAASPKEAAARIDPDSPITPARQTQDEGLLALEKKVMEADPAFREDVDDIIDAAKQELKNEALMFSGEKGVIRRVQERARQLLIKSKQYLFDLVDIRLAKAANEIESSLSRLDPNADARDISRVVRASVDNAYDDALRTEDQLWGSIDSSAELDLTNAKQTLDQIMLTRSKYDDPDDVPKWLVKALTPEKLDPRLKAQLQKAGAIDADGNIRPEFRQALEDQGIIRKETYTFNDAKAIRSRLLAEVRAERAKDAPNRNKIRILNNIANGDQEKGITGILDDMSASGVEGVDEARQFSRYLNNRFRQGKVGHLLGFERTGERTVTEAETLDYLLVGRDAATTVEQLVRAAPETSPMVENYLKTKFLDQVLAGDNFNQRAANAFIAKWKAKGAFEAFPGLEDELRNTKSLAEAADKWRIRNQKVRSYANSSGKSRVALYLDAEPGEEMARLLNSKRPAAVARKVISKVNGDQEAIDGLKTSFLEEGFKRSKSGQFHEDGSPIYSGRRFSDFLDKYEPTARALGVTDAEWSRLENIANRMRELEVQPGKPPQMLIDDKPAAILDLAARWIGARAGGRTGDTLGSSLVLAGAFSERMRNTLGRLTRDHAQKLLIEAHKDPKLYRALLLRPDSPPPRQEEAASVIEAWMLGSGLVMASEPVTELETE